MGDLSFHFWHSSMVMPMHAKVKESVVWESPVVRTHFRDKLSSHTVPEIRNVLLSRSKKHTVRDQRGCRCLQEMKV